MKKKLVQITKEMSKYMKWEDPNYDKENGKGKGCVIWIIVLMGFIIGLIVGVLI